MIVLQFILRRDVDEQTHFKRKKTFLKKPETRKEKKLLGSECGVWWVRCGVDSVGFDMRHMVFSMQSVACVW